MIRKIPLLYFIVFNLLTSCSFNGSIIKEHVDIEFYTYEQDAKIKASAMPVLKPNRILQQFSRRFDYLLINTSKIHLPQKANKRSQIWSLYPDTAELKQRYIKIFIRDRKLENYFETTIGAIQNKTNRKIKFSSEEMMEVASKFFYCDSVFPDTTVQSHICIGLNGTKEANWKKDYTILEAFCYEAIFSDIDKEHSAIDEEYTTEKQMACVKFKTSIASLNLYLIDVRNELFMKMKQNAIIKQALLSYYEQNYENLAFKLVD